MVGPAALPGVFGTILIQAFQMARRWPKPWRREDSADRADLPQRVPDADPGLAGDLLRPAGFDCLPPGPAWMGIKDTPNRSLRVSPKPRSCPLPETLRLEERLQKMQGIHLEDYLSRKTLILGDVNTGKTNADEGGTGGTACAVPDLGARIAIVDMAPEIPEKLAREKGLPGVGGKLTPPEGRDILYLAAILSRPA